MMTITCLMSSKSMSSKSEPSRINHSLALIDEPMNKLIYKSMHQCPLIEIGALALVHNSHMHRFCNRSKAFGTKGSPFSTGCAANQC
jgi:hypothetical protein